MEATHWLLECTQCLPGAEEISAKIMGGDDDVEVVEVEAVAAVSRDDESEDNQDQVQAKEEPAANASASAAGDDDGVSSGRVLKLPTSMVDDTKKEKGSPSPDSSSASPAPASPRTSVEVSATTPRGKFDLTMHEFTGIVLRNKKEEVVAVPSSSVATVIVFPKAEDCRKATNSSRKKGPPKRPGNLVLLVLKEEAADSVQFRGKSLKQICIQLPQSILPESSADDGEDSDGGGGMMIVDPIKERDIEMEWVDLLGKTFGMPSEKVVLVSNPAYLTDDGREERAYVGRYNFKSDETEGTSTTTAGMPYVKCYEGVNDGVLFPLEEGLLFFKPPKFVPRSTLHSIQCGRGGGDSRYVDLVAQLEGEGAVEFSNISREEVRVLNDYIHQVLIRAMTKDAEGGGGGGEDEGRYEAAASAAAAASPASKIEIGNGELKMGPSEDSGDDSIEFVDFTGGRSRRAASREAREATKAQLQVKASAVGNDDDDSDDDDEEDFVIQENDSEEDDSDASGDYDDEDEEEEADVTESEDEDEEDEPMKKKAKML
jgi:hypothetical protein